MSRLNKKRRFFYPTGLDSLWTLSLQGASHVLTQRVIVSNRSSKTRWAWRPLLNKEITLNSYIREGHWLHRLHELRPFITSVKQNLATLLSRTGCFEISQIFSPYLYTHTLTTQNSAVVIAQDPTSSIARTNHIYSKCRKHSGIVNLEWSLYTRKKRRKNCARCSQSLAKILQAIYALDCINPFASLQSYTGIISNLEEQLLAVLYIYTAYVPAISDK